MARVHFTYYTEKRAFGFFGRRIVETHNRVHDLKTLPCEDPGVVRQLALSFVQGVMLDPDVRWMPVKMSEVRSEHNVVNSKGESVGRATVIYD